MRLAFTLLAFLMLSRSTALRAADKFIVAGGEPKAEIIIAERPTRITKLAVKELQGYVAKMSGATLPVVTDRSAGKTAIFVGMSKSTEELGLSTKELKHGAFRIASGKDWLALLGPDKDFVPIEPWGRDRSPTETARVNGEWDKITGDTFWNAARDLHTRWSGWLRFNSSATRFR